MIGPIPDARDLPRQRGQIPGQEITERLAARINVLAAPINEIHRDVEHVVDVALEPDTRLEHKGQCAAAVRVSIGPDNAAGAEDLGGPSLDTWRISEQCQRD